MLMRDKLVKNKTCFHGSYYIVVTTSYKTVNKTFLIWPQAADFHLAKVKLLGLQRIPSVINYLILPKTLRSRITCCKIFYLIYWSLIKRRLIFWHYLCMFVWCVILPAHCTETMDIHSHAVWTFNHHRCNKYYISSY